MELERVLPEIDLEEYMSDETANNEQEEIGNKTPLYDFEKNEFVVDRSGRVVTDDGVLGMQTIIEKSHKTARNVYVIYSENYGSDEEKVLTMEATETVRQMKVKEAIRDCLIYDDRINEISPIELTRIRDGYVAKYTVYTIFGDVPVERQVT